MLKTLIILITISNVLLGFVATFTQINGEVRVLRPIFNPIDKIFSDSKIKKQTLIAYKGFKVEEYDIIQVAKNGSARILFLDETKVMLGKNTLLDIQKYQFDEKESDNASLNIQNGMFNFITGKIGKIAPEKFSIKTKTATIGIRGTEAGCVDKNNLAVCYCSDGGINTDTPLGDVDIPKGMKTTIKPNLPPQTPIKYVELEGYAFGLLTEQLQLRQKYSFYPHRIIWEIKERP